MATMSSMIEVLVNKIEQQAGKTALLQQEIEQQRKRGDGFEQQLCQEKEHREWTAQRNQKLACERDEARQKYDLLYTQHLEALDILGPLSELNDVVDSLRYKDQAVDFFMKWIKQGLQKEAVNGATSG